MSEGVGSSLSHVERVEGVGIKTSGMRIAGIDLLRGVAAFGIVGCHLSLAPRTAGGELVTALCDFNVGLFAAVAGFLMCGGSGGGSWLEYLRKRARRLLPTYFVWSLVFIMATIAFDLLLDGGHLNPKYGTAGFWGRVVFVGDAATHLWFLACLFYAQAILHGAFRSCADKWHGLMWIGLGGVAICMSVLLSDWFGKYPLRLIAFLMTGYGFGCCLQGGMFDVCKRHNGMFWCVAISALVLHVLLRGFVPGFIRDWFAVGPVMLAFIGCGFKSERWVKVAVLLGATSLGVYLVHPLITRGLSVAVVRFWPSPYSAAVVLGEWVLAWCISFAFVNLLRRMPVAERFV